MNLQFKSKILFEFIGLTCCHLIEKKNIEKLRNALDHYSFSLNSFIRLYIKIGNEVRIQGRIRSEMI